MAIDVHLFKKSELQILSTRGEFSVNKKTIPMTRVTFKKSKIHRKETARRGKLSERIASKKFFNKVFPARNKVPTARIDNPLRPVRLFVRRLNKRIGLFVRTIPRRYSFTLNTYTKTYWMCFLSH